MTAICSVEGCDRPLRARGWCATHYQRWHKNGDVKADRPIGVVPVCSVEDCDRPHFGRGWCQTHYTRWFRNGSPDVVLPRGVLVPQHGEDNPQWKGGSIGYSGLHQRLVATRGKASAHTCVDCGEQAREWSLTKGADSTWDAGRGLWYSVRPEDYEPRCVSCHKRYDLAVAS